MREVETLLHWYDRNAREMPWRVGPGARAEGIRPDPYAVWLSEVMLQQTTVAAVTGYFLKFTSRWPRVEDLAAAEDEEVMRAWAGLGYYARARNLLKCARAVVADHGGRFPDTEEALLTLPGIGAYTAAAISAIAFDRPATVLDGNVERVMARYHAIEEPLPGAKETLRAFAARYTPDDRPGDWAQAVMDLGATICTPRSPACGICPLMEGCAGRLAGIAAELPRKLPKKAKPVRRGIVYVGQRDDGAWLIERRPEKGLLGGMLALPTTEWGEGAPAETPPADAAWRSVGEVRQTFTHFHLILDVAVARIEGQPSRGTFRARHEIGPADLPTVFAKAFRMGAAHLETTQ
ncbi:MAG: A/G-specific adenine glycosylase [Rubricella sp.]